MRGKWLYLSVIGAFGLFYGVGMPLPVVFAPTPKEPRQGPLKEEEPVPLVKGYRYVLNYLWPATPPQAPRIARPPQPPPPTPVAAPEPPPPVAPARQFVEPPRAGNQGFTALAVQ